MASRNGGTMERNGERHEQLRPEERELALHLFGDLPEPELTEALFAAYAKVEMDQFGSPEAAAAHYEMVNRLEADMIADLEALEERVRGL